MLLGKCYYSLSLEYFRQFENNSLNNFFFKFIYTEFLKIYLFINISALPYFSFIYESKIKQEFIFSFLSNY